MSDQLDRLKTALADRYTIQHELGAGGMATVYLAEDLKHHRQVALKILRPELAAILGGERFLKEIEVTANLQHPNILPLYDSGEADTFLYYVMPYIEGESLRDKLDREKQLGVEETVEIAKSVAAALQYAHERHVVHRDIKPENILLQSGQALVADFGIALAVSAAGGTRLTETGLSLGTPHYMSPEQATGDRELDARSDVYSLGAVVYEMLTGDPPHTGNTMQAIVAKVLTEDPTPITRTRNLVPPNVDAAVQRALAKTPADRFTGAAAFAAALTDSAFVLPTAPYGRPDAGRSQPWKRVSVVTAGLATVFLLTTLWGWLRQTPRPVYRLGVAFPEGESVRPTGTKRFAISADGWRIVYVGPGAAGASVHRLWVRQLDQLHARPLPGTDGAVAPFFSPDGQSVAFFTGSIGGDLKIIASDGGPVQTVAVASANPWGGSWGPDGKLYFNSTSGGLARVPSGGGAIETVSTLDSTRGETDHEWPDVLPNGKGVLIQIWRGSIANAEIGVLSLETGTTRVLTGGLFARYVQTGHLLYSTFDGTLMVAPFDADRMELTGAASVIEESVRINSFSGVAQFDLSANGHLVYQSGGAVGAEEVVWVQRDGSVAPVDTNMRGDFANPALSPDGTRLALAITGSDGDQIWVKQLDTGPLTRLTLEGSSNYRPAWSPDGRSVTFLSNRSGRQQMWTRRADGSAPAELLVQHEQPIDEGAWSRDGQWLVFRSGSGGSNTRDIWGIRPGVDTVPRLLVGSPADEYAPALSPDGRWLAYVANESGREEVYVRPFPETGEARTLVSVNGGTEPRWSNSGRELFYRARGDMVVQEVVAGPEFQTKGERVLFDASVYDGDNLHTSYAISPDDNRFVMVRTDQTAANDLVLVLNWMDELAARVGR